jgi:LysM repeat protein
MARKGYVHPSQRSGAYTPTRGRFAGQQFGSYRQYQNASAQAKGYASATARLAAPRKVAATDTVALSRPSYVRALGVLNRIRKGDSLSAAAREAGTTAATVKRYVGRSLTGGGGRIAAKRVDRLAALMQVPTTSGPQLMVVVGSRSRRVLGEYYAALQAFRDRGDPRALASFANVRINVEGTQIPLPTDPRLLTRLLKEGRLSVETIYAKGHR